LQPLLPTGSWSSRIEMYDCTVVKRIDLFLCVSAHLLKWCQLLGSPGLDRPWLPLNKERRGFGLAPPGTQGNNNETPQAVREVFAGPAPEPGEDVVPPPEIFPTDRSVSLTQVQIGYISRWYNNDFGVRVGDNAEARTKKFHDFLCGQ